MSPTAKSRLQSSLSSAAHATANASLPFPRLLASGKRPCDTRSGVVFMILIFFGNFFFLSFFFSFSFLLCGLYLSGNSIQTPDAADAAYCCWRCACGWRIVAAVHLLSKGGLFCFRFVLRHALSLHLNAHLLELVSLLLLWSRLFAHQTVVRSGSFWVTGGALAQVGSNFHTLPTSV